MSASNWDECPRCLARARTTEAEQLADVMATYGKVPAEEYARNRMSIPGVREADFRTFREDYEIYGASKGTVCVSYSGRCDVCGLSLDIEQRHPIKGASDV
jgi:hypothetical protein